MAKSDRLKVRLGDGSVVVVTPKTGFALDLLRDMFDRVALGQTTTFVLIEQSGEGSVKSRAFSQDLADVKTLGDELVKISARLQRLGSVWEGTAPANNRSVLDN